MPKRTGFIALVLAVSLWMPFVFSPQAQAQQTLGGITGAVTEKTGGVLPETVVTIVGEQTKLTRTQKTNPNGIYDFVNLPNRNLHAHLRARRFPNDIPIDDVTQNINFNGFPASGQSLYVSPTLSGLGITNKTIGSPRQIQMSLSFMF
jgi:hypothetical protein